MLRLALTALAGLSMYASADTLEFNVDSQYPYTIQLEFYSQNYNRSWPGGGRAYEISDYDNHTYVLNCQTGEKICYGAWAKGKGSTYWGVGANNRYSCKRCCYYCGGSGGNISLTY